MSPVFFGGTLLVGSRKQSITTLWTCCVGIWYSIIRDGLIYKYNIKIYPETYKYLGTGNPVTGHVSQLVVLNETKAREPKEFPKSPVILGGTLFVGSKNKNLYSCFPLYNVRIEHCREPKREFKKLIDFSKERDCCTMFFSVRYHKNCGF